MCESEDGVVKAVVSGISTQGQALVLLAAGMQLDSAPQTALLMDFLPGQRLKTLFPQGDAGVEPRGGSSDDKKNDDDCVLHPSKGWRPPHLVLCTGEAGANATKALCEALPAGLATPMLSVRGSTHLEAMSMRSAPIHADTVLSTLLDRFKQQLQRQQQPGSSSSSSRKLAIEQQGETGDTSKCPAQPPAKRMKREVAQQSWAVLPFFLAPDDMVPDAFTAIPNTVKILSGRPLLLRHLLRYNPS